jgi:hypothetical protein
MKLNIKINNATARIEKIKLEPELVEMLDSYIQFYQRELSASIKVEKAIAEMLIAFIKSDRHFMRWHRNKQNENAI